MSFIDHFNSVSDHIIESKTGTYVSMNMYGFDSMGYVKGELGPVNFWASNRVNEHFEQDTFCVGISNPLVVKSDDYTLEDLYFATRCVGYAVENGYDSVIIETSQTKYAITINFEDSSDYLFEADGDTPSTKNTPKKGTIPTTSKKAPPTGIRVDVLLANTGKLSPKRVERAMKGMRKTPPKITGVKEIQGDKYFRAEYNFKSNGSPQNQLGYADVSQNKEYCTQLFCTCSDFFYRLYAPYVKAGLSTWNVPPSFKSKHGPTAGSGGKRGTPHNHHWTVDTNPEGKLFLCKHLWAFIAYYVAGDVGSSELSDEEIEDIISKHFADVDDDGEEERVSTDFEKAFGKLYMGQKGKGIKHVAKPLVGKKPKPVRKNVDVKPKDDFQDILSQIDKNIKDTPEVDNEEDK